VPRSQEVARPQRPAEVPWGYHAGIVDEDSPPDRNGDAKRAAAAWLDTVGAGTRATILTMPGRTIVPAPQGPGTTDARALAMFAELADRSLTDSAQLRHGEVIGQGGMGVIRAAEQVALGRTVAVKTLRDRRDQGAILDLLREAWVTGSLEHPNVVPVHYLSRDNDGLPIIVLKRIDGVEWRQLLADPAEVARRFGATDLLAWNLGILMQVLNAVRFAHSRGIIHRDLKPSNVMIGDFGEVYLLDWGIAVSLHDDVTGRLPSAVGATIAGTPCFMAPEMLGREGSPPISERTDVYLAGAVLYELVTGGPPHTGAEPISVITSILVSQPQLPPDVPGELARICTRAMHEDPAQRFESADALRLALQAYVEHRGSTQLAERAHERLDQLRALLEPGHAVTARRDEIYRLYGACRSGFHDALAVWTDNEDARRGLTAASVAVAEFELAVNNPAAAVTLLGELAEPPPLLATARIAVDAQLTRRAELEHLDRQHDPSIGTRTRTVLVVALGLVFTIAPLLAAAFPALQLTTLGGQIAFSLGAGVLITFLGWWARESMRATLINRRILASAVVLFALQTVLAIGTWSLGLTIEHTQVLLLFLYAATCTTLAIDLDAYFAVAAVGYVAAFVISARLPEHRMFAMGASNLVFTVNAIWRWHPATLRRTAEERASERQIESGR